MKTRHWLVPLMVGAGVWTDAAQAATISNLSGQSCSDGMVGTWHFINNQTGGASAGTLYATWSTGETCDVPASKVNASNQHFYCFASGTLTHAETNLRGRLVLSDFSCQHQEQPPEEPPCDDKKQVCPAPKK